MGVDTAEASIRRFPRSLSSTLQAIPPGSRSAQSAPGQPMILRTLLLNPMTMTRAEMMATCRLTIKFWENEVKLILNQKEFQVPTSKMTSHSYRSSVGNGVTSHCTNEYIIHCFGDDAWASIASILGHIHIRFNHVFCTRNFYPKFPIIPIIHGDSSPLFQ